MSRELEDLKRSERKSEKDLKKYLTNETEPDIIVTVPLEGRAPCKLNNEKHEQTPWTILIIVVQ